LLTEANIMYLVQMDIIMCGTNLGKNFGSSVVV
jgi:broad specificity polyphosphatase/5'/3'-nucleotidase SurE